MSRRAIDCALIAFIVWILSLVFASNLLAADDAKAVSANLSNQAFALLNSLTALKADGSADPGAKALVGPVASFAGDAQTLNQALGAGDNAGARRATASLDSDAESIDAVLKAHKGAIQDDTWNQLKHELAAIEKSVPPAASAGAPPPPSASSGPVSAGTASLPATAPAAAPASPPVPATAPSPPSESAGPVIKIESRRVEGDVTRLKGYFEGSALKSAGIYEGGQNVKPIKVDNVIGRQRVDFQLSLRDADVMTNLRVFDQAGRMATASVFGEESKALASSGRESGVLVDRGSGATSGGNTAEIPSAKAPASGGLERTPPGEEEGLDEGGDLGSDESGGGLGAPMGNIQVNVESVNAVNPLSHVYQVSGQIIGHGVHRAGIYVDGRLVKRLPVSRGANLSNFHTTFIMNGGTATIRAFGSGNQYVESSIQMPPAVASSPPIVVAPYGASPYGPFGMNPYGADPFGGLYGNPYGGSYGYNISPFGITRYPISPYGTSPYGAAPFGVNPYAPPINPYGNARPMGPAGR